MSLKRTKASVAATAEVHVGEIVNRRSASSQKGRGWPIGRASVSLEFAYPAPDLAALRNTSMPFSTGMSVRCRGQRCVVLDAHPVAGGDPPSYRLRVRATEGPLRNREWPVLYPLEPVEPDELPPLALERAGRDARFRLLHEAFI